MANDVYYTVYDWQAQGTPGAALGTGDRWCGIEDRRKALVRLDDAGS